jgi:peptidoglycan/LPS O-acetylase OafA/YrhL
MADRPRLPALTSLRFFAALHLCVFHLYAMKIAAYAGWFHQVASIGYVGVNFFFVLSGFILVYTYADRHAYRMRRSSIYYFLLFLSGSRRSRSRPGLPLPWRAG